MRERMDNYLKMAVSKGATDLHLTAGRPPQLRIDGELQLIDEEPLVPEDIEQLAFSILGDSQIGHFRSQKELDTS